MSPKIELLGELAPLTKSVSKISASAVTFQTDDRRINGRLPRIQPPQHSAQTSWTIDVALSDEYTPLQSNQDIQAPPPYCDAAADAPPSYDTQIKQPLCLQCEHPLYPPSYAEHDDLLPPEPLKNSDIDFSQLPNVRQAANKKAKKAQKAADQAKWAGSGDEGGGDAGGAEGGEGNGGGEGGGGGDNNGDGGAGDDGGGDDWADSWGASNKKKKGKKAKEEEKKKQEEEEERKKAEEENQDPLSWANEEGDGGDWAGFATKKDKKKKKEKTEPAAETDKGNSDFDDIHLDGEAPKVDLSFGSGKDTKSDFGFGGWGSKWETGGNTWAFSAADAGTRDIGDTTNDGVDSGPWSFGGNKKSTKKKTTSGFDFGSFGDLDESKEDDAKPDTKKADAAEGWGAFGTGKKDKKSKKKSVAGDVGNDIIDFSTIGIATDEPTPTVDDTWGPLGGAKKDKKKSKKGEDPIPGPPPPPPAPAETSITDEFGGFGTKKKDKKGKKITEVEEPIIMMEEPEPNTTAEVGGVAFGKKDKKISRKAVGRVEEPTPTITEDPAADPLDWGSFGGKKDKKKGKKDADIAEALPVVSTGDPGVSLDFGWGSIGKTDKKKGKMDDAFAEADITAVPDAEPEAEIGWGAFGAKKEKDKKKKKSIWGDTDPVDDPTVEPIDDPAAGGDDGGALFGAGKKDKKKSKQDTEEIRSVNAEPLMDDTASIWGTGSKKDKKKKGGLVSEVKDDAETKSETKSAKDAASVVADDDLGSAWGDDSKKKGKKSKRNSMANSKGDDAPPPPPPVPAVPDVDDGWGVSKKDKKGKKGKLADPVFEIEPEPVIAPVEEPEDDSWAIGLTKSQRKKEEKRREEEKKAKAEEKRLEEEEDFLRQEEDFLRQEEEKLKKEQEEEDFSHLSPKERKKKEKEREKARKEEERLAKEKEEEEERLKQEEERLKQEEEERLQEEEEQKARDKDDKRAAKLGKKGKTSMADTSKTSKTNDLLEGSVPDDPVVESDTWGSWGATIGKKDKDKDRKKKKDMFDVEPPPPAPTPPAQGLTEPEDEWAELAPTKSKSKKDKDSKTTKKGASKDVEVDLPGDLEKTASKDRPNEESAARAARNFWSGTGGGTVAQAKAKTKEEKKEEAELDWGGDDLEEIGGVIEEEHITKKSSKDKSSKLTKATSKDEKPSKNKDTKAKGFEDDVAEQATGGKAAKDSKSKKSDTKTMDIDLIEKEATPAMFDYDDDEGFGWGSMKKTSGNTDELKEKSDESKKEIGNKDLTNQKTASASKKGASSKVLEELEGADQPSIIKDTKSSKTTMSTSKLTGKASVKDRVRQLEKDREEEKAKAEELISLSPEEAEEPQFKLDKKGSKARESASRSKVKDFSPVVDKKEASKDLVPGGFPDEIMDMDDLLDLDDSAPLEKKSSKKDKVKDVKSSKDTKTIKEDKKSSKEKSSTKAQPAPPTPPPEPKEEKSAKKERPRIAKSTGLWGAAAPKKEVKKSTRSKDDADVSPPKKEKVTATAAGLSRSKSTRTAKDKDKEVEKSESKSSDSEKPKKKAESRPSKSRGSSFGALFGAAPPSRTKSVRRNSTSVSGPKATSRALSDEVDDTGLPSPPPEDAPKSSAKASKILGTEKKLSRSASTKGKSKPAGKELAATTQTLQKRADKIPAAVPDPYPIDDDDMVMVNGLEDPVINAPIPKSNKAKSSKNKSRKDDRDPSPLKNNLPDRTRSKRQSKTAKDLDEDDVVMVDAASPDGFDVADGPDDLAFVTKPKGLQRSNTASKRPESKMGGLFGAFRKSRHPSETFEHSKAVVEDDVTPRKRTAASGDDSAKRVRRKSTAGTTPKTDRAAEGYVYNTEPADAGGMTEAEAAAEARREERRKKRAEEKQAAKLALEAEQQAVEDRRSKRRKAERDARAKDEADREARRAARRTKEETTESRRAKEEDAANRDLADEVLLGSKTRTKRRETSDSHPPTRPSATKRHSERRKSSYLDPTTTQETPSSRPKSSRRKSTAPNDDYLDTPARTSKSSRDKSKREVEPNDPYGGNDHTSSWVKSQLSDPPAPPPVEGTILEGEPDLRADAKEGEVTEDFLADEEARRKARKKRRSKAYVDVMGDEQEERDKGDRRRSYAAQQPADGYYAGGGGGGGGGGGEGGLGGVKLGGGEKTWDAKTGQGKRSSWFGFRR